MVVYELSDIVELHEYDFQNITVHRIALMDETYCSEVLK